MSAAEARAALATIEDSLAPAGWPWNEALSRRVDELLTIIDAADRQLSGHAAPPVTPLEALGALP